MKNKVLNFLRFNLIKSSWILFLIYTILTLIMTVFIVTWDKNSLKIENLFVFLVKLTPFFFALFAIACFPENYLNKVFSIGLILLSFIVMWVFFIPRLFYLFHQSKWENFYMVSQMLVPFIILSLLFSYKLGGGKIKEVLILGTTSFIFMLSGIEDFCYFAINGLAIPDKWVWAEHMKVRLGFVPSKNEAFIFIGVHFFLIILILFLAYNKYSPFMKKSEIKNSDNPT